MALEVGDVACTNGLSGRIFDYFNANIRLAMIAVLGPIGLFFPPPPLQAMFRVMAYAVARAVVDELHENGQVKIDTSAGALQQYAGASGPVDTTPPTEDRFLPIL